MENNKMTYQKFNDTLNAKKEIVDSELKDFLVNNGMEVEEETLAKLTNKEKLRFVRNILTSRKVDSDLLELCYQKQTVQMTRDEYLKDIHNIELNILNARHYIGQIKVINNLEKKAQKLQRKEKIMSKFIRK